MNFRIAPTRSPARAPGIVRTLPLRSTATGLPTADAQPAEFRRCGAAARESADAAGPMRERGAEAFEPLTMDVALAGGGV